MKKVISLDGGGTRGIVSAIILRELEERMQSLITDRVNLVAGTSTGSIIAGAIAKGIPMENVVKFYLEEGPIIFSKKDYTYKLKSLLGNIGSKYDEQRLYKSLDKHFGDTKLKDCGVDFLATAYNISDGKPRFFSTQKEGDLRLSDVIAASSSAPTFFKPKNINSVDYIDGGVFCSNPAMSAYAEIKSNNNNLPAEEIMIVSVGTGSRATGYRDTKWWFKYKWINPLIDLMMSSDAGVAHYQLVQIYESINKEENYFRLNGVLPTSISRDMSETDPRNQQLLIEFANSIIKKNDRKLSIIVDKLK